ncbi:unnamed protein product [Camellia sinensis]
MSKTEAEEATVRVVVSEPSSSDANRERRRTYYQERTKMEEELATYTREGKEAAKEKTSSVADTAAKKARECKDLALGKAIEYKDYAAEKVREANDSALEKAGEYKDYAAAEKAKEMKAVTMEKAREGKDSAVGKISELKELAVDAVKRAMDLLSVKSKEEAMLSFQDQWWVGKKEGIWKNSTNGPHIVVPIMNDTHSMAPSTPVSARIEKYSNLERLEASLGHARAAIREALTTNEDHHTQDPDYTPTGPIYWNATAFHSGATWRWKSTSKYLSMKRETPQSSTMVPASTHAIEGLFIQGMEISKFRTGDPERAHLYFLPFSVTMITQVVYVVDSHDWGPMKNTAKDYVDVIANKYPYWNRSHGADHFMLACHDWGPEISFAVPNLYNNSIRALCNANTSEKFNPSRDVSIPEIHLPSGTTTGMLGGPSPSHRPLLVFYAGGVHSPIRPILLHHWQHHKDPSTQIHEYLPKNT